MPSFMLHTCKNLVKTLDIMRINAYNISVEGLTNETQRFDKAVRA